MYHSASPSGTVDLTHDDSLLLLLVEMFPALAVEELESLVHDAPAGASPQLLVDRAIALQDVHHPSSSSPSSSSSSSFSSSPQPSAPALGFEMTSLLPAHSSSEEPAIPVPSAPVISNEHAALLSASAALHGAVLASSSEPSSLLVQLRALLRVVSNPLEQPAVQKYRMLPLSNPRFMERVLALAESRGFIEAVGFRELAGEALLILSDERYDPALLHEAKLLVEEEIAFVSSMQDAAPPAVAAVKRGREQQTSTERFKRPAPASITDDPLYKTKREWQEESKSGTVVRAAPLPTRPTKLTRDQMAAITEHRLHPTSAPAPALPPGVPAGGVRRGRQMQLDAMRRRRAEMEAMRRDKKGEWLNTPTGRRRVITLDDLEAMRQEEVEQRARLGLGMSDAELVAIGKEATRLTNDFRRQQGVTPDVVWNPAMAEIGWKHSKNMAEGKVPFGHDGFPDRVREMRMRGAGENVFMCEGRAGAVVAQSAVEGWINSPGHRKNMLGRAWTLSGIGVFRTGRGGYYLTQLFAHP